MRTRPPIIIIMTIINLRSSEASELHPGRRPLCSYEVYRGWHCPLSLEVREMEAPPQEKGLAPGVTLLLRALTHGAASWL